MFKQLLYNPPTPMIHAEASLPSADTNLPFITSNHTSAMLSYNFIPNALCTLKLCLMLKSNIISSLPPGIA